MNVVYSMFFMHKHWFCWKYQYNKYMINFINIYIFIPASGCIGRSPSALLCSWAYSVVKMALLEWTYVSFCFKNSETINWNLLKHKSTYNCIKKFSIKMKNSGNIQKYFVYTSEVLLLCGKIGMLPCIYTNIVPYLFTLHT